MRSSIRDAIFVVIHLAIFFTCSWLLYADFNQRIDKGEGRRLGTITFKRKHADRRYSGEVIWETIQEKAIVYDRDYLRTEADSEAVIELDDGTTIELGEETLILLARLGEDLTVDFHQGRLSARGQEADQAGAGLKIKSGETLLDLQSSDAVINKSDALSDLSIDVTRGSASLKRRGEIIDLSENTQTIISVDEAQDLVQRKAILPKSGNSAFLTEGEGLHVQYSWEGGVAGPYRLIISRDSKLGLPFFEKQIEGKSESVYLEAGNWYWSVRDNHGGAMRIERTKIIAAKPPAPLTPAEGARISFYSEKPLISFSWVGETQASAYELEVFNQPDLGSPFLSLSSQTALIASQALDSGRYWWRVKARFAEASDLSITGPVAGFEILKSDKPPPLELVTSENRVTGENLMSTGTVLTWQGNPECAEYLVEVSATKGFSEVLYSEKTSQTLSRVKADLPLGEYHWRVTGLDEHGRSVARSSSGRLEVVRGEAIIPFLPEPNASLASQAAQVEVNFSWIDPNQSPSVILEIARDENFSSIEHRIEARSSSWRQLLPLGRWWWRVTPQEESIQIIPESRRLNLVQALARVRLLGPENQAEINMSQQDNIVFSWGAVPEANAYDFRLFSSFGSVLDLVFETRLNRTELVFDDLGLLDRGDFVWEIIALKLEGGEIVTSSEPSRRSLGISLERLSVPVINTPGIIYTD